MGILDKTGGKFWSETNFDILDNVIESGSGSTSAGDPWNWIKFPDGTMLFRGRFRIPVGNNGTKEFVIPVSFLSIYDMDVFATSPYRASGTTSASFVLEAEPVSPNIIRLKALIHTPTTIIQPTAEVRVPVFIIGRYK